MVVRKNENNYVMLSYELRENVLKDYMSTLYYKKELAVKYKVSVRTIYRILEGINVKRADTIVTYGDICY